jgi:hypothetical protein
MDTARKTFVIASLLLGLVTAGAAADNRVVAPPNASQFAVAFVRMTNGYAADHGDPARVERAHCVEAASGRYMCSYVVRKPGARNECHLMQARWTPAAASTITVTLAGRTKRCGTLRDALRSLP